MFPPAFSPRLLLVAAVLLAAVAGWVLVRPLPEIEQHRRHFAELQRQVTAARASKGARASERGRVLRLRAQARAAGQEQRATFEAEAAALDARIGWGDDATVRAAVLASPIVPFSRETSLGDFPPAAPERGNGCLACHVSLAAAGYETYPAPFRTHPGLAKYVGAASPHPPSRVGCVSCHMGDAYATTFVGAGHTKPVRDTDAVPAADRAWGAAGAVGAMLPVGRTEAGCVACHLGERYQPGAIGLSDALLTLDRGGCYACHAVPGMERAVRRGPDLRRIRGKLSPEWVRQWLTDPASIKPSTWMPAFWTPESLRGSGQVAVDAAVAYLFANSDGYTPAVAAPPRGDAARGQQLVESVGCLGCHVAGEAPRDTTSLRRTFGQPLQALGGKTSYAWLVDWLRDPSRYSPATRMPNLRLSGAEAADIATWLQSQPSPASARSAVPPADGDEPYRALLREYDAAASSTTLQLTGEELRVEAGRTVIDALGCFNCHEVRGFEERTTTAPMRPRPHWDDAALAAFFGRSDVDPSAPGALQGSAIAPHRGTLYRFGRQERARLALALTAVAGPVRDTHALSTPWHLTKVVGRTLVQERNCVGCHTIEGGGGDLVTLVAEPTLGPPLLTPEGSRVQPAWLRRFLHQPETIRPWLSVRMPTFGLSGEDVETVGGYFRGIAPENPGPTPLPAGVTAAAGRDLFELLKCQQCHVLGGIPKDQPTANLAPDLRLARERLQPEWILAWLRDPSAILPGTRMPSFWPDYPKSFYEPLGKDGATQVRAIRDHLLTLH